jgi:hypothetical protein
MMSASRVVLLLFSILLISCSSDKDEGSNNNNDLEPGDELSYELFPSTKLLDSEALAKLSAIDNDGTLHFTETPPILADLKPHAVLLAGASNATPHGLLRFVIDVKSSDAGLDIKTIPAPIQMAFKKLHVVGKRSVSDYGVATWNDAELTPMTLARGPGLSASRKVLDSGGGHASKTIDFFAFDADKNPLTTDDQVRGHSDLSGGIDYHFGVDVDWGGVFEIPEKVADCLASLLTGGGCSVKDLLPEVKVGFGVEADAAATLSLAGAAFRGYSTEQNIASVVVDPPIIEIWPLVFVVGLDVLAHINGGASSEFAFDASTSFTAGAGVEWSSKSGPKVELPHETHSSDASTVKATLKADASLSVGPQLSLRLYDVLGVTAQLNAKAALGADLQEKPCWALNVGADLVLGFVLGVEIPGYGSVDLGHWDKTFKLFSPEVANGDCVLPKDASTIPPGGGADAEHFANPTFTPWSRTYNGTVGTYPVMDEGFQWTDVNRSIDGNYVVSGTGMKALVKLDESGDVVWARSYTDPQFPQPANLPPAAQLLTPERVAPSEDAALFVCAAPYEIFKVGQHGTPYWAARFTVDTGSDGGPHGNASELSNFTGMVEDGEGGVFISASYEPPGDPVKPSETWLMRLAADGSVIWSKRFSIVDSWLVPTALVRVDDGVVLAAEDWDGNNEFRAWIARIDANGDVVWSKRYKGTDSGNTALQPEVATVTAGGNVIVAGRAGALLRSFILAIKPDGTTAWMTVPWSTSDLSYLVIHSIQELPTTGFVLTGSYTNEWDPRELFLAGADASGHLQWLESYQVKANTNVESGFPALRLTDDGGIFVTGYTRAPDADPGSLWAMKTFAKDGAIDFDATAGRKRTQPFETTTCTHSEESITPEVTDFVIEPDVVKLESSEVNLTVAQQTSKS